MMKPCRMCRHYSFVGLESTCRKTRKTVGALWERPCFEEKEPISINPQTTTAMEEKPKTKVCKSCGHELPVDQFGPHPRSKDGLQAVCRTCASQARKGRRISRHPSENEEIAPPPKAPEVKKLDAFADAEILEELRRRGYKGQLSKTINL